MRRPLLLIAVVLTLLPYGLYQTHLKRMPGFCISKVLSSHRKHYDKWEVAHDPNAIRAILSQTFHYFGSGKTCYVFLSDDGQYVIKLFKQRHMRPFSWFEKIAGYPLWPKAQRNLKKRLEFRHRLYDSFKLAYDEMRAATALVYLHLNRTTHLEQKLYFIDKKGKRFVLDADQQEFLIQKKADRIFPTIAHMEIEPAKALIDSIIDLVNDRCQLGILDNDNNCERNLCVIDGKAVEVDIGELIKSTQYISESTRIKQLKDATRDLNLYLKNHLPELSHYLTQRLEEYGAI